MLAVAHDARLAKPSRPDDPKSPSVRQDMERLAARGNARAQAALEGPEMPQEFRYLREWSDALFGRSGVGMSGVAPLSHGTVLAWSLTTGHRPTPAEVEALMLLDTVRRDPSIVKIESTDEKIEKVPAASRWPTRKAAPDA
jgi:hypothetical protein